MALQTASTPTSQELLNPTVNAIVIQSNNKILIGGEFTTIGGATTRNRIARLNTDGTPDTFDSTGVNAAVNAIAFQSDGKIVIGGDFTATGAFGIARLTTGGTLDGSFSVGAGANDSVKAIAVQKIGSNADKIIITGNFTTINTTTRSRIARLNPSGNLDTGFHGNQSTHGVSGLVSGLVRCILVGTDDRIVIGGDFDTINSNARRRIGRLLANGDLDDTFRAGDDPSQYDLWVPNSTDPEPYVASLAMQSDGLIVTGGIFARYQVQGLTGNTILRGGVARIGGL